jgi:hypothetical protein
MPTLCTAAAITSRSVMIGGRGPAKAPANERPSITGRARTARGGRVETAGGGIDGGVGKGRTGAGGRLEEGARQSSITFFINKVYKLAQRDCAPEPADRRIFVARSIDGSIGSLRRPRRHGQSTQGCCFLSVFVALHGGSCIAGCWSGYFGRNLSHRGGRGHRVALAAGSVN